MESNNTIAASVTFVTDRPPKHPKANATMNEDAAMMHKYGRMNRKMQIMHPIMNATMSLGKVNTFIAQLLSAVQIGKVAESIRQDHPPH